MSRSIAFRSTTSRSSSAIATPIWFKWANKDKDAARVFKAQLEIMESPSFGYVTPDMYKGQKLDL